MSDRELPLNSPDRFSKRSPSLVRDRIADVGCAGAVYRWRPRSLDEWILRVFTPGAFDVCLDGEPWRGARRAIPAGLRLITFQLTGLPAAGGALLCGLTSGRLRGPHDPDLAPLLARADGSLRYRAQPPHRDWRVEPQHSATWPALIQLPFAEPSDDWGLTRLQDQGAQTLGATETPAPTSLWVAWHLLVGGAA